MQGGVVGVGASRHLYEGKLRWVCTSCTLNYAHRPKAVKQCALHPQLTQVKNGAIPGVKFDPPRALCLHQFRH